MSRLFPLTFAVLIALSSLAQTASAAEDPHAAHAAAQGMQPQQGGGGHAGGMGEMMMQHMQAMREHGRKEQKGYADIVLQYANDLKLSDEQIGKITRIHQAAQKSMEELGPKMHDSLKATHEVFLNPASDEAAIRKTAKEHTSLFNELVETALKSRNEINAVLTTDQLKQLQAKKVTP